MKHKQTFSILIWVYRRKTTDKIGTLYARVTVSGIRAEISLSRRINVSSWDDKNSIVKPDCNEATEINEFLDIERGELRQCFYQLRSDNKPITAEAIKLKYLGLEESGGKSLLEAFQYHNDQMKGLVGKNYSLTTYKKCMVTIGKLKKFLMHTYNRTDILLSDLKYKFITDFEYYLRTEHNLSNNSAMGYIKILKKIVKISVNNEWIPRNPFASFVCKIEARERQVLNDSDIEKLKNKKFHSARLEQVRDVFLFSCFTGYAYADVQALTQKHIGIGMDGEKWIFTSRMKTDNRSNVLLLPEALELIEKYKDHPECIHSGKLFPVRSNQKYNDYLKEVAELCGIDIHLTTHIARHTFATTVTLANDVPIESVSSMLGHKNLRTTQTGSKRLILGTTTWLYNYVFYDRSGRVIQVRGDNHLFASKQDLVTNVYDFEGKLLKSKLYHKAGVGMETTVYNRYEYDGLGSLIKIYQRNNSDSEQLLVAYEYNELGQLVDKKLHNTGGSNYLQSIDYRYNIHGQLISINNAQLDEDANNDELGDYFGMELLFNKQDTELSNDQYFDGNISAIKWKGAGSTTGVSDQRSFKYLFDKSDRLKSSSFQAHSGGSWDKETGTLNEAMTYDHNGNIKTLQRFEDVRGFDIVQSIPSVTSSAQLIDDLTYTYEGTSGNRLMKVEDASSSEKGFNNGVNAMEEYFYDTNGNLTKDENKGISNITYNFLGKPTQITLADTTVINYTYDAAGNKLSKSVTKSGNTTTTDYTGGFVYQDGILSFFGSPEGRVVNTGSSLEYQYAISDHQGNTRIVFSSITPDTEEIVATFEADEDDDIDQFGNIELVHVRDNIYANSTAGGQNVIRMNQGYELAMTKSIRVYPGDEIDLSVSAYYDESNYGTSTVAIATLIETVAGAFGGISGGGGESGAIFDAVDNGYGALGAPSSSGSDVPTAHLNYMLFDQQYNLLSMGWKPVTDDSEGANATISFPTIEIEEAGIMFVYLSYEGVSNEFVYFDDLAISHTKSNIIQYNEYYPFGMQTANSWTRENVTGNNFLYNGPGEINTASGLYETQFRSYDPILGRFMQVDPLAASYGSLSPYNYAANNPAMMNDPTGLYPRWFDEYKQWASENLKPWDVFEDEPGGGGSDWSVNAAAWRFDSFGYIPISQTEIDNIISSGNLDKLPQGNYKNIGNGKFVYSPIIRVYWKEDTETSGSTEGNVFTLNGKRDELVIETIQYFQFQIEGWPFGAGMNLGIPSGPFTGSDADGTTYFEGVKVITTEVGAFGNKAAATLPGVGIFVNPEDKYNINKLRHEFGHILQARLWGIEFYITNIIPTSLLSADAANNGNWDHDSTWTEWTANLLSWRYFGRPADWKMVYIQYTLFSIQIF